MDPALLAFNYKHSLTSGDLLSRCLAQRLMKEEGYRSCASQSGMVFVTMISKRQSHKGDPFLRWSLSASLLFLCLSSVCVVRRSHGREQRKGSSDFIEVHVSSLLPQEEELSCKTSPRGGNKQQGVSLEVVHRHGPCSKLRSAASKHEHEHELLVRDQERVDSILKRNSATLPAKSGSSIGSGNYIVSVGLGTPKKELSLVFDTGSDLTWTQCEPCVKSCYKQVEPTFNPTASSSYLNISCTSSVCNELVSATGVTPVCSSSNCVYGIQYGDSSFSAGFFARETLTLSPTVSLDGFLFGCGENNQGLFGGSAGLLGLGRDQLSLVSQASPKFGNYFSYCLPPGSASTTGHLTLGRGGIDSGTRLSYTPLLTNTEVGSSFYFLDLQYMSVGSRRLPISPTVFSTAGTLIDSGTVITRLPPKAYSALTSAFKQYMSKYPSAPALSILDTCYDLTDYQTISVPKVALFFRGGALMDLSLSGILYAAKASQVCLAFAPNTDDTDTGILGNVQQQSFDVVYDVDGGRIGFRPNAC